MCLKELMLIQPMFCISVLYVITGTIVRSVLDFSQDYAMVVII